MPQEPSPPIPDLKPIWQGFPWLDRGLCDCGEPADYELLPEAICILCAEGPPATP